MSDRPSAVNGKRNKSWGTTVVCPACGQCLCFGCHPAGPCVDENAGDPASSSCEARPFHVGRTSRSSASGWYAEAR